MVYAWLAVQNRLSWFYVAHSLSMALNNGVLKFTMKLNGALTVMRDNTGRVLGMGMLTLLLGLSVDVMAGEQRAYAPGVTRPGATIYQSYCSVCHGDKGDGQSRARSGLFPPPRNYTTPEAAAELTRERMIHSVTNGRPGTAMIAWRTELSKEEIDGVVDYIRTAFMRLDKNQAVVRKAPDKKLLASRGGVLYMQACAMCHGDTGSRATTGRMQPPPRDFTLPGVAAELTRERMIASVSKGRPGTAMQAYGAQYSAADIAAMVDFIREAFMSGSNAKK